MNKFKIKKNDMVLVLSGNDKDVKGSNGKYPAPHKVLKVLVKEQRAIVEGVNMVSKSTKPSAKHPQGGIIKQEAPIQTSAWLTPRAVSPLAWPSRGQRMERKSVSQKSLGRKLSNEYSTTKENLYRGDSPCSQEAVQLFFHYADSCIEEDCHQPGIGRCNSGQENHRSGSKRDYRHHRTEGCSNIF